MRIPSWTRAALAASILAAAAAAEGGAASALGRWQGTYLCTQGWTGVDLTIEELPEAERVPGKDLQATFAFYEIERNPGVPSGRFVMRGHFDAEDGHLDLGRHHWLKRPPRYVMVDLHGRLDPESDELRGQVSGPGCGGFTLRRADGPPTAGSWLTGR